MPVAVKIALLIVAAVVLAVVARMFYVSQNAPAPRAEAEIRVRVAATNLPAGLLLRDDDLAWTMMRLSAVPANAVTERSRTTLEGSLLRRATPAGRAITTADIMSPESPGFLAAALPPDMRAVSIPVNEVSGNAGLIRPGDHVDLLLTQDLRGRTGRRNTSSVVSETIVQNARVIAVGGRIQGSDANPDTRVRTVTLQVAPRAAEVIAVATRLGTLSLALRSFAITDRNRAVNPGASVSAWTPDAPTPIWASDVSQAIETLDPLDETPAVRPGIPVRPSAPHTVTVIRGTSSSTSTWQSPTEPPSVAAPASAAPAPTGLSSPAAAVVELHQNTAQITRNVGQALGQAARAVPD